MMKFGHDVTFDQARGQIGKGGDKFIPVFLSPAEQRITARNWRNGAANVSRASICRSSAGSFSFSRRVVRHKHPQDHSQSIAFFMSPGGIPPETRAAALTFILGKRGIRTKQETLLISDWQRQCPHLMVQMKPVTQSADGGEGTVPYCWSWPSDFLSLAPPLADYIMYCGR
jgi:hypothetical protein